MLVCAGLFGLGVPELAVMAGAVDTLSFSPRKLPEIGKGFGKTVKSFSQVKNSLPPQGLLLCKLFELWDHWTLELLLCVVLKCGLLQQQDVYDGIESLLLGIFLGCFLWWPTLTLYGFKKNPDDIAKIFSQKKDLWRLLFYYGWGRWWLERVLSLGLWMGLWWIRFGVLHLSVKET